jgi:hypothetical protein
LHSLFLGGDDVKSQHRQHRAVHGHRHAHLVERNAVEEGAHVENAVDRHTGHAHVAGDSRVIAVIAAVRGEVEGDAQALLPGSEVAAVEGVRFLGRGEASVLADRPGPQHIHGRIRPAQEGRDPRHGVEVFQALQMGGTVERVDGNAFGSLPGW